MTPSRNQYGMIGPISQAKLTPEAIRKTIADSSLTAQIGDKKPVHVVITNSTYDGLLYNVAVVEDLLGRSVDRLHFDEAWYGYARFHPMYANRFAMYGDPKNHDASKPTVFATQSTHKLLAALSQSSMIHVRDGRNPVEHARFNESYMMHASTSPLYPIIISNEVSAAIMDGPRGTALMNDSIAEAVAFRQSIAKLHARFATEEQWFFKCWQPESVTLDGKKMPFAEAPAKELQSRPELWTLEPDAAWHGFKNFPAGYAMLDPIKVTITTPGMDTDGRMEKTGIPAPLVTAYLNAQGIIPEKTENFSMLFLFSLGITKGKWGTLNSALLSFKQDYDANTPLTDIMPNLVRANPGYASMGLRDLGDAMFRSMSDLRLTQLASDAFDQLPRPVMSPTAAHEKLVRGEVESRTLAEAADPNIGCIAATGIVPYPPGIPLLMPGESMLPGAKAPSPALKYLQGLETFDRHFPTFSHDTHGIEMENGLYRMMCLK
jgi:lysine decarboxylase/arginine decarboxylase